MFVHFLSMGCVTVERYAFDRLLNDSCLIYVLKRILLDLSDRNLVWYLQ